MKRMKKQRTKLRQAIAMLVSCVMVLSLFPSNTLADIRQNAAVYDLAPRLGTGPPIIDLGMVAVYHGQPLPSQMMVGDHMTDIIWEQAAMDAVATLQPFHIAPLPGGAGAEGSVLAHFTGTLVPGHQHPGMSFVSARFIAVPSDTVLYIDSIGHFANPTPGNQTAHNALNGVTRTWQAVRSLIGDDLINNHRSDQPWVEGETAFGHAGHSGIRGILDGGRSGEPTREFDTWMYGLFDTPGPTPIMYYFYLYPGTYTITSGHHQWWTSNTRGINTTIQIGDAPAVPVGSINLPNIAATSPDSQNTISGTFVVDEPSRIVYRVYSQTGAANPLISWLAVNGTPDPTQIVTLYANGGLFDDLTDTRNLRLVIANNNYADIYLAANTPSRVGFTFDGWFTDPTGITRVNETDPVTQDETRTLYAGWTSDGTIPMQQVTLNANNGHFINDTAQSLRNVYVEYPGTYAQIFLPVNAVQRPGYLFEGWFTAVTGGEEILENTPVTPAPGRELFARWYAGDTVPVAFNMNRYFYTGGNNQRGQTHPILRRPLEEVVNLTVGASYGDFFDAAFDSLISRHRALTVASGMGINFPNVQGTGWDGGNNHNNSIHNRLLPVDLERGFEFVGWFTQPVGGVQIMPGEIIGGTPRTLYAQWAIPVVIDGNEITATAHLDRSLTYKGAGVLSANSTTALLMGYTY